MEHLQRIQDFEVIKILADARRLAVLQLLMARPMTLSHLGHALNEQPAQIRHHLKLLERAGLVEMVDTRPVRGFIEKYYRAKARAFVFQGMVLPASPQREVIALLGSHDMALDVLAQFLSQKKQGVELLVLPVGSLEGLVALRQGTAQLAACHLLDVQSGEYNLPYVRHLFPDREVQLITLAHREQGLLVAPGNPLKIRSLEDLTRPDVTLVNRIPGSGTRLWLDTQLGKLSIPGSAVLGYNHEVRTHTALAEAIRQGKANVGLGLEAAARQYSLDFIPLFQERFDLVLPQEQVGDQRLQPLFEFIESAEFRKLVEELGGYDTAHTGEQIKA